MDTNSRKTITVGIYISKPLERVWDLWTGPEHITQWNFANDNWQCPSAINELKRGENFSWRMESKDGKEGFDFKGVYEKIIPNETIVKRLDDGRQIIISFKKLDHGTKVTETFEADDQKSIDVQRQGWQAILDNFKNYASVH